MPFIYELISPEDYILFNSLNLKDCWGVDSISLNEGRTKWCIDRDLNAYLVDIGGRLGDLPHFYCLWWKGHVTKIEIRDIGTGNYNEGVHICWSIERIIIPRSLEVYKDDIPLLIYNAFSVNSSWCKQEFLKSISVRIQCEPEISED